MFKFGGEKLITKGQATKPYQLQGSDLYRATLVPEGGHTPQRGSDTGNGSGVALYVLWNSNSN